MVLEHIGYKIVRNGLRRYVFWVVKVGGLRWRAHITNRESECHDAHERTRSERRKQVGLTREEWDGDICNGNCRQLYTTGDR